jgi:hypothetical protein
MTAICIPKQIRNRVRGVRVQLRGSDLSFRAALTEAARHQDAIHVLQERRGILALEHLGFDPVEIDAHLVGDPASETALRSATYTRP